MTALRVRGIVLPDRVERTFWIDGDRIGTEPLPGAETVVDGGWLLPGLVDAHTHPGSTGPGHPFDDGVLRDDLGAHRDAGVLLVRTPGSAGRIPKWVDDDPDLPRVRSAGRWLATPGRFFPGWGRDVTEADLVEAAVEEAAASSGWCKVIGDWLPDDPAVPLSVLTAVVEAVHAIGGKVAVHCQTAEGTRNAVEAGVDSLEHGLNLDPALVDRMAAQGTALVPTLGAFGDMAERGRPVRGWDAHFGTVGAALEAGVTVLAGTDSRPCGTVAAEVGWLIRAGLGVEAAVGAASWTAREWLGVPGLVEGAPADLVAYDRDPTVDPSVLGSPGRVVLRGRVVG
ncbi:amidohydrolase family protein [Umezawaea sp. Da 62-37]|uniref:amidohydrolase family protein n=1 Tax=Umezawaea sp. Da 62-37 TaxID=3075927 RepID=UPI0028F71DC8|nr:amidohydrolase family protein [Umezawaea sp. Da 62-37]WNV89313.1 amidohydrolase family protein [Umezawaea sp. Da 62-37]